ncbi:hypothetical protein CHS0354_000599 [Potamilus streckersoni]|uniref:Peptidase S24/S26A/S26B/S26C domain-containing protein n=1 Tax=Potamilus streckersoni TaxID=2493646 RepID=A0AAE0W995_9BIVA|nr:hypothetical protein CHS0354_000599 [Potamilus streckersoni]
MDRLTLGNGSIVNMYSNTAGYDLRRPGIQIRLNFPVWGLQIFTSDVTSLAIFGTRIYTRPLYPLHIPIVSNIEVGGSVVTDVRSQSGLVGRDNSLGKFIFLKSTSKQELPLVFGFDLTLPIVQFSFWDLKVVADYVNFLGGGNGLSAGIINTFNIANVVNLSVKFEHRENFKGVAFGYFDGFYEISRHQIVGVTGDTISTAWYNAKSTEAWRGFKASLALNVMSKIVGVAGYERRYDSPVGGRFFAYLEAPNLLPSFALRAEYFKRDTDFNLSLFSIDDHSTARLIASYSFNFIMLSVVSQWSFAPEKNASGAIIGYIPQQILFFRTGFPSPAFDVSDVAIDLNKHFIKHPSATFFARVKGHSMKDAGIDNGDLLIVDKSIEPKNGKIAVCYLDDQFTLKRLRIEKGRLWLVPANDVFEPIEVKEGNEVIIWGIVAHVIKSF